MTFAARGVSLHVPLGGTGSGASLPAAPQRISYDAYGRSTGWSGNSGNGTTVGWDQDSLGNQTLNSFTNPYTSYNRVAYKTMSCPGFYPSYTCAEVFTYTASGHVAGKKIAVFNGNNTPVRDLGADVRIRWVWESPVGDADGGECAELERQRGCYNQSRGCHRCAIRCGRAT